MGGLYGLGGGGGWLTGEGLCGNWLFKMLMYHDRVRENRDVYITKKLRDKDHCQVFMKK